MTAVENHDFTLGRYLAVNPPQEVVLALGQRRRLECHAANAKWIDRTEYALDGTILARGIHTLQNHNHFACSRSVKHILQFGDFLRQDQRMGTVDSLVAGRHRLESRAFVGHLEIAGTAKLTASAHGMPYGLVLPLK